MEAQGRETYIRRKTARWQLSVTLATQSPDRDQSRKSKDAKAELIEGDDK